MRSPELIELRSLVDLLRKGYILIKKFLWVSSNIPGIRDVGTSYSIEEEPEKVVIVPDMA